MPAPAPAGKTGMVIATSYLVMGLIDPNSGIWQLPLQWLLKTRLGLSATDVAIFFAIALSPWYLKPLAGLVSDAAPLLGSRRRSYLLLGSCIAAIGCAALALVSPTWWALLLVCLLTHAALMLVSTVTGGVLVEEGQRHRCTGALTSLRSSSESVASLCAAPIGGWLAGHSLGVPAGLCTLLAIGMTIVFARNVQETWNGSKEINRTPRALRSIRMLLSSGRVWIVSGLFVCYQIAPGFQTPLFFYQSNALHFSAPFIGLLGLTTSLGSILGALLYALACRRIAFRRLFPLCMIAGIGITTCYFSYKSTGSALAIEAANGVFGTMAFVALLDLIARNMPRDHEAMGYAFVFSLGNAASSISDMIGSKYFDAGAKFTALVWLNVGTTALILLAIPFLWKSLSSFTEAADCE